MERITSSHNPRVALWRSLKDRKGRQTQNAFLVEGFKSVSEALHTSHRPLALILRDDVDLPFPLPEDVPTYVVPDSLLSTICDTKTPQGIAAVMPLVPQTVRGNRLIALDGVQDPGNVGTILRTADAAGLDGILLSEACADIYSPKVLRATMGSVFHLPCERTQDLPGRLTQLREGGMAILSSVLGGDPFFKALPTLPDAFCLVIGNEGNGISPEVQAVSTHRLMLPMHGNAESLNAAIAAAIMMYALTSKEELAACSM
ncbi:MAG: RNA methyltransferase [Clostridia bacterium]|nr:RNA methyltransferase [Clostridia bacterium]